MTQRPLPRHWPWLRRTVRDRDGYCCVECGNRDRLEVDHIISRENGGTDDLDNLQTLCRKCHIIKTKRDRGLDICQESENWDEFINARGARKRRLINDAKL